MRIRDQKYAGLKTDFKKGRILTGLGFNMKSAQRSKDMAVVQKGEAQPTTSASIALPWPRVV